MTSFKCAAVSLINNSMILLLLATWMLVVTPTVKADGCFQNVEIFKEYTRYMQPMSSLDNRIYYFPAPMEDPTVMTAETEKNFPKYWKKMYTCLEEYEGNRMLVQVLDVKKGKTHYQCLQFKSVTENIIRQAKTKLRSSREKVNCMKDKYATDQALLIAWEMLKPEPCPLIGGYQTLFHEGEVIKGHCLDSILTYNPSLRFQCDGHNVIADFGEDCLPSILKENQKMRRRQVAHLSCVGNWSENGDVKSVLLQMRDMPYDFWCIHYKRMNATSDLLSIFMTLDGRCVEDAFHDESFPRRTSMFGQLARYIPSNDPSCSNPQHLDACKNNEDKCFESDQCPGNCQRCNYQPTKSQCRFMEDTQGSWQTIDSKQDLKVDVTGDTFDVSHYGKFSCRDEFDRDLPGRVYPVVQEDEESSCMPYYACASVVSPVPGVLNFQLKPASRHQDSVQPMTCKETEDKIGYVTPVDDEKMITMVNFEKLERSSCGFHMTQDFPIQVDACMLVVDECDGDCKELHIHYDNKTCGSFAAVGFAIETDHVCYGKFHFHDGIKGLLTYSEFSDRYFCWMYNADRLFISSPGDCNSDRVGHIFKDYESKITYDPANRLMKPSHGRSKKNPGGNAVQCLPSAMLVFFLLFLVGLLGERN